jgi:hypothetical protein
MYLVERSFFLLAKDGEGEKRGSTDFAKKEIALLKLVTYVEHEPIGLKNFGSPEPAVGGVGGAALRGG